MRKLILKNFQSPGDIVMLTAAVRDLHRNHLIVAGGKRDFTIKWWSHERYHEVVDYFRGKIFFVQVGENGHAHRPLRGVLNLLGQTTTRQLVRLMYHAQGVLSPVTFAMHLAAAVEGRESKMTRRPCVVVAGGREPAHWEAYPGHQFIHTIGALPCCAQGGCWKSRTIPLGDGDAKDEPQSLCVDVHAGLPRCMEMISAKEVCRRIELYFAGGMARYLSSSEREVAREFLARSDGERATRRGQREPVLA